VALIPEPRVMGTTLPNRVRLLVVTGVLVVAVWLGLKNGVDAARGAASAPQRIAAGLQVAYGVAAAASLVAMAARRAWLPWAVASWALTLTATATIAPIVWGGADWSFGALGGLATASLAGLVAWGAVRHARSAARHPDTASPPNAVRR